MVERDFISETLKVIQEEGSASTDKVLLSGLLALVEVTTKEQPEKFDEFIERFKELMVISGKINE